VYDFFRRLSTRFAGLERGHTSSRERTIVDTGYAKGVTLSGQPVDVDAIFGGQWPHSSFMIPNGVMRGPNLADVTRSVAIFDVWKRELRSSAVATRGEP
jgi:Ni,Fe-hydrogenase I large subunit